MSSWDNYSYSSLSSSDNFLISNSEFKFKSDEFPEAVSSEHQDENGQFEGQVNQGFQMLSEVQEDLWKETLEVLSNDSSSNASISSKMYKSGKGSKRKNGEIKLSEFVSKESSPGLKLDEKNKRRKRARTEEERNQRAAERKIKNRQSAMRSRQRVLNELKTDKEEILLLRKQVEDLKSQNEKLIQRVQRLEKSQNLLDLGAIEGFKLGEDYDEKANFGFIISTLLEKSSQNADLLMAQKNSKLIMTLSQQLTLSSRRKIWRM